MIEKYFVADGEFSIDGIRLPDLLAVDATPCYVYSARVIKDKYRTLREHLPGFEIFYSFKANPNLAISRTLLDLGANADVSSLGELKGAFKVGFRPENVLFVGPGKTEEELYYAIANGVFAVIVESAYELQLVDEIAGKLKKHANVMLRINTLEAPTAPEIMSGGPSKFGIDEETVVAEVRAIELRHSTLSGIHVYSASQVLDPAFISQHLTYVAELALRLSGEIGFELKCIDFGGGFGVPYAAGEAELDLAGISSAAKAAQQMVLAAFPNCRLALEVGRFLVAEAGIFLTKVTRIKPSRGKTFIITDAGMNHFTRPAFMHVNHSVKLLNKMADKDAGRFDICGPICTPLDVSGVDVALPSPQIGDIVGFFNAGAYGCTMSMVNFMSLGWPSEIMVDGGRAFVIRKARRADDLFENQNQK